MPSVEEIRARRPLEATVARWFALLPYCWLGFSDPGPFSTIYAVLDIVAVVISGFSLTLMYHPATNRYIHLVTVARRAELR